MRGLIVVGAVLASLTATSAAACSLSNWNRYTGFGRAPAADLYASAATVDWIEIETPPEARCPRELDWILDRAALEADDAEIDRPRACQWPATEQSSPLFQARVLERLKGASDQRFSLIRYVPPRRLEPGGEQDWSMNYWSRFTDLRLSSATTAIAVSMAARNVAEGRHRNLAFWDNGEVDFAMDRSSSCGGSPTLDPEMRYVVFRDAIGSVLALEPVLYTDDRFLERLRAASVDPATFTRTPYAVADFFQKITAMVEGTVEVCTGETGPRASYRSEKGRVRVTRGDTGSQRALFVAREARGETAKAFDDLWDFYQVRGEPCPVGEQVLLVTLELDGEPQWPGASDWVEARFPGWQAAVRESLVETGEQDEITPVELYVRNPLPRSGYPRPIRIHDGRIRLADIPTGLTLEGPEWIPVDQAFAWFEEGRAARTVSPVPSSS